MRAAVFGGDKRMLFAAKAFADEGCEAAVAGFDNLLSLCDIKVMSIEEAASWCDIAVLPVRPIKDGCLNMPFSERKADMNELMKLIGEKSVFCGCGDEVQKYSGYSVLDYASREDFTCYNAQLTAEGALGIILSEYEGSVYGSEILVMGWGRIGKLLSRYLYALGAGVTVAARKLRDRSMITLSGMTSAVYADIEYDKYDIVFNTVPALVADKKAVDSMKDNVYIIDLASSPGGVDFKAAADRGLTCVHALSLPGKTAPLAAGRIIKDTIFNMIKEENGGKDNCGLCDDRLLLHLR